LLGFDSGITFVVVTIRTGVAAISISVAAAFYYTCGMPDGRARRLTKT
jgi:hypothetical protein